jgi:hypothetical protein
MYYISNKGLHENCDKEENLAVTGAVTAFCMEIILKNVLSNVTYSPNYGQGGAPMINIQSTLCTAPICVKMFHCSVIW